MEDVVVLSAVEGVSFGHGLSVAIRRSCFSKPVDGAAPSSGNGLAGGVKKGVHGLPTCSKEESY